MPEVVLVRDLMRTPVVTALPTTPVREIARLMIERGVGSVVITDDNGALLGIVTKTDIVRDVVARGLPREAQVGEIMTRNPYYVMETTSIDDAAELMASHNIGHLPVLNDRLKLVGIISRRDIVKVFPHFVALLYVTSSSKPL